LGEHIVLFLLPNTQSFPFPPTRRPVPRGSPTIGHKAGETIVLYKLYEKWYFALKSIDAKPEDFCRSFVDDPTSLVSHSVLSSCTRTFSTLYEDRLEGNPSFRQASASSARSTADRQASSKAVFGRLEGEPRSRSVSEHLNVTELKRMMSWPGHLKGRMSDGEGVSSWTLLGAAGEIAP
jgi:hypothetical protein